MIIAIASNKGGVGKTTTALNLGAALQRKGKRVLLVDLDGQSNLTTSLNLPNTLSDTVGAVMLDKANISQSIRNIDGLHILPASMDLVVHERDIMSEMGNDSLLREVLSPIQTLYDHIIIDCPPSLGILTVNALVAADYYITPLLAQTYSYDALAKLLTIAAKIQKRMNPNLKFMGAVFANHSANARTMIGKKIEAIVRDQIPVFQTVIRTNIALVECVYQKTHIYNYAPDSIGAQDHEKLATELINITNNVQKELR